MKKLQKTFSSLLVLSTRMKHLLRERLCRIEFCQVAPMLGCLNYKIKKNIFWFFFILHYVFVSLPHEKLRD
jgi:hypothetical protein